MRRRRKSPIPLIILTVGVLLLVFILVSVIRTTPEESAEDLVRTFYQYEQEKEFGSSWELFHKLMKEKFAKSDYIQKRNHVFVGDFGTDTFTFTLGDVEKLDTWKMAKNAPTMTEVYKIPIAQTFKSTYGTFTIKQDIFVTKEKEKWTILWSYQ